jgi:hypothetical protein
MVDFRVNDAMPGDEIALTNNQPLRVKIRAWGLRGASAPVKLELLQFGKPLKVISASTDDQEALEIETTLTAAQSCWLAVHARGRDGSQAHTTPIYLVRPGERFWDVTQAEALIGRQLSVLAETEAAVDEAERRFNGGANPNEFYHRWPAQQAEQIRQRIQQTRQTYEDLRRALPDNSQPSR